VPDKLTSNERLRFLILKKEIKDGLGATFKVAKALTEIRDNKLYREEFETFEDFCLETYKIGKAHAYRLISAGVVKEEMNSSPMGDMVQTERQARALAKVPKDQRAKVLEKAAKSDQGLSAAAIAQAAAEVSFDDKEKKAKEIVRDATGYPVPKQAMAIRDRDGEVLNLLSQISKIKSTITAAQESNDPLWRLVNHAGLIADLAKVYTSLAEGRPFAICNVCSGRPDAQPKGICPACQSRGWLSKYRWNQTVPEEFKLMRKKSYAST
jgi:hypothetical protein